MENCLPFLCRISYALPNRKSQQREQRDEARQKKIKKINTTRKRKGDNEFTSYINVRGIKAMNPFGMVFACLKTYRVLTATVYLFYSNRLRFARTAHRSELHTIKRFCRLLLHERMNAWSMTTRMYILIYLFKSLWTQSSSVISWPVVLDTNALQFGANVASKMAIVESRRLHVKRISELSQPHSSTTSAK